MLRRRSHHGRYVVTHRESISVSELGKRSWNSINELMVKEKKKTRSTFEKVCPFINQIFSELANHDVRFEFDPMSFDTCCKKISTNVYSVLCFLKQLPKQQLVVEGNDAEGALKVRLSRSYEQSYDTVCWDDILLPADKNGCQYFSTVKLQKVLSGCLKHAINDVKSTIAEKNISIKTSIKNHLLILGVKVRGDANLSLTILPAIHLDEEAAQTFGMQSRLSKLSKQLGMACPCSVHIVAQPMQDYPEVFWRISANDIENRILSKMEGRSPCFGQCLFALCFINEQYYVDKKITTLLPLKYIYWALMAEGLKTTNERHWREGRFIERIDSILTHLKNSLAKGVIENIVTGANMLSGREPAIVSEFERIIELYKNDIRGFLLSVSTAHHSTYERHATI